MNDNKYLKSLIRDIKYYGTFEIKNPQTVRDIQAKDKTITFEYNKEDSMYKATYNGTKPNVIY